MTYTFSKDIKNTVLEKILKTKVKEVAQKEKTLQLKDLKKKITFRKTKVRDFYAALSNSNQLSIMAEIKKASPSGGLIRKNFDYVAIAKDYENSEKVAAISVLTDTHYFQGDLSFITDIKKVTTMPIFRKDFIFCSYQIYESYLHDADALLLIAAALDEKRLKRLINLTHILGMGCLVETHSKEEIEMAIRCGAKTVGINARDLKTFTIDKKLFSHLSCYIPEGIIKVAESGLETKEEILKVRSEGADAILIGTAVMKATDIQAKLKELFI